MRWALCFITAFTLSFVLWSALVFPSFGNFTLAGIAASAIAATLSSSIAMRRPGIRMLDPRRWIRILIFSIAFILVEIKSHIEVIKSILTGKTNPAIIKVPVTGASDLGRMFIANAITLTPGTFTVKDSKYLYVHCLNFKQGAKIAHSIDKLAGKVTE